MIGDGRAERRVSPVDKVIHVTCPSHGFLHLLHGSFHLMHLSLQVGYSMSDSTSRMISSLNVVFSPFILKILPVLLATALSTVSVNFSS